MLDERIKQLFEEDEELFEGKPDLIILPLYAALPPQDQVQSHNITHWIVLLVLMS